jgi:hypothetical protein
MMEQQPGKKSFICTFMFWADVNSRGPLAD